MRWRRDVMQLFLLLIFILGSTTTAFANKQEDPKKNNAIKLPPSVVNIAKENTFPNTEVNLPHLQPSEFTKKLIDSSEVKIQNPNLIRILNESAINNSPLSIGVRATIFLGEWPLNYESAETVPHWQYQKINTNYHDNRGGVGNYQIHYVQEVQKSVKGALTAKVPQADDIQKMMLLAAMEKTKLPLTFHTTIGAGTKNNHIYNVPPKKLGYLYAYVPSIYEKGQVTSGEVYLVIKGTKRKIVVKNVTAQPIGAWIPIHDHLSFGFNATN